MIDLNALIKDYLEESGDIEPGNAAIKILDQIPWKEREGVMLDLITHAISNQLSRNGTRKVRHNPAQNPRDHREEVTESALTRPFFVPSQGTYVYFKDMTVPFWEEWIKVRRAKAKTLLDNVTWASRVIQLMVERQLDTAGQLPGDVIEELFTADGAVQEE